MPITSRPDHVAIAVHAIEPTRDRWIGALGGRELWQMHTPAVFRGCVVGFRNGAHLEVLEPSDAAERTRDAGGPSGFLEAFLGRFGPRVHHVTLKVDDIREAVAVLEADGIATVDHEYGDPHWQEAFVPPSIVGGLVVQIAQTDQGPDDWAAEDGRALPALPTEGAALLGPLLLTDDLERAAVVWGALGGSVAHQPDGLLVTWPDDPLSIAISTGDRRDAIGLRFAGTGPRPTDTRLGPAVIGSAG